MKKLIFFNFILTLFVFCLTACFSNEREYIGEKRVKGSDDLYLKIYQKDEFEYITPVYYKLLNKEDSVLIPLTYFAGESPMMQNVDNVYPFLYESVFYICYPYPVVQDIQYLDSSKSLSRDTLFKIIKKHDSKLIDGEKQ